MKKALKHTYLLLFMLCVTLVLADFADLKNAFSTHHFMAQKECSDVAHHSEETHPFSYEIALIEKSSKDFSDKQKNVLSKIPVLNPSLKNPFLKNIWQPPKIS